MSEPPDKKSPDASETDRADKPPSVRSFATGTAGVVTAVSLTVGFLIGGPLGVALAGAVVASGGVAGVVGVHRLKNPRSRKTRPGVLHALLARPRRTGTPGGLAGKMTRTVTQARRTATSGGTGAAGRKTGRGRFGLPKMPTLPAITAKGRAKRAAAATAAGTASRAAAAKKTAAPRAAVNRPGGKPAGTRAPSTPSRTPARAGAARKLATAPGRTRTPKASGLPTLGGSRRTGTGAAGRRTGIGGRRTGVSGGLGKIGTGKSGTGLRTRKTGAGTVTSTGRTRPVPRPKTTALGRTPRITTPTIRRPKPTSGSRTTDRLTRGPKAATTNAKRLGNMRTPTRRIDHRRAEKATPIRTAARPRPYSKAPTKTLVHDAMRLPRRNGWKIHRPTEAAQRKARRTLVLRSKVAGRRAALKAAKAPVTVPVKVAGWSWLHRPLWIYPAIPSTPDPEWGKSTEKPRPPKPEPVTRTRRHRTAYPDKTARRAPEPVTAASPSRGPVTMSNAADAAADVATMIANHKSDSVTEFLRFLDSNAAILRSFGQAYRTLGQRAVSEMPFASPVGDSIASLGAGFVALEQMAAQMAPTLRAAHPEQMKNIENRVAGAEMFDIGRN